MTSPSVLNSAIATCSGTPFPSTIFRRICPSTPAAVWARHTSARTALRRRWKRSSVSARRSFHRVPAAMASLLDHRDFPERDLSKVRMMINIGAPELLRLSDALPQAKKISCYGLTESGGICSMSSPHDALEQWVAGTGRPLHSHHVRIVDPDTLEEAPRGSRGEIVIRGPIFSGYYGDPAQTQKVMLPGGWLRSGDLGWVDEDGQIAYAGRHKDMLKIGGENCRSGRGRELSEPASEDQDGRGDSVDRGCRKWSPRTSSCARERRCRSRRSSSIASVNWRASRCRGMCDL